MLRGGENSEERGRDSISGSSRIETGEDQTLRNSIGCCRETE